MENKEAIHLIKWLQETPTAKQFYGTSAEELLRYYKEQNSPLKQMPVMSSAYWVELNGGNILIVIADSVGDACDKLDSINFENYSIKHEKTMVSLV